jgi:hypothetical protein
VSKQLNEPQAWREIARRIAEGKWRKLGLCAELCDLCDERLISCFMMCDMEDRINQHVRRHGGYWAYKPGTEPEARALAALWLALEAEEESI